MRKNDWTRGSSSGSNGRLQALLASRSTCYIAIAVVLLVVFWMTRATPSRSMEVERDTGALTARVDMHSHSTESDGDRIVDEQMKIAKEIGLHSLWITDHDMIRSIDRTHELQATAARVGLRVGFGVEITVDWDGKEHHLLGYFPDSSWALSSLTPEMLTLQKSCADVKESRENRNIQLTAFLNKILSSAEGAVYFRPGAQYRQPFTVLDVSVWATANAGLQEPTSLGRPHFSKYLMAQVGVRDDLVFGPRSGNGKAVITSDNRVLWDQAAEGVEGTHVEALMHSATLARRNIAFKPLPIVDAIVQINAAHGRAVVAHIPTLGPTWIGRFGPLLGDLKAVGLWGIEAFSSEISEKDHKQIHRLAMQLGLEMTGGSDNHGTLKKYAKLGQVHRAGDVGYSDLEAWARGGARQSDRLQQDL